MSSSSSFSFKRFTVCQDRCAMKVGVDGTLLGAWAHCQVEQDAKILDIGTGTGLLALMMAQRYPYSSITALDIDAEAVRQASENACASPFAAQISVILCPVQSFEAPSPFDAIVCNPPFFEHSLLCPDAQRTTSRHTTSLSFLDLMKASFRLLSPHGELSLIIPLDALSRMEEAAAMAGFFLLRKTTVRTTLTKPPKRLLLSYTKTPHAIDIDYSEIVVGGKDYQMLTQEFYL